MSTSSLQLPELMAAVLRERDATPHDFDEAQVSFVLERKIDECGDISDKQRKAYSAEIAALQMRLTAKQGTSRWGTRFGPMVEMRKMDGTLHSSPDIAHIDALVIEYWQQRAAEVTHPVFKARYADVLWDMTKAATGAKPPIEMARQTIDAYVECGMRFQSTDTAEVRLERALELALSVKDKDRAESALSAMVALLDVAEHPGSRLIWLFDLPHRMKGVAFSDEQEAKIVQGLESELKGICESEFPISPVAKDYASRLALRYEAQGKPDDVKRVIRCYGKAVKAIARQAQGLVAMHWLQEAYGIFLQFGLKAEAETLQIAAKAKGEEAAAHMVNHSFSVTIPGDKLDKLMEEITADGLPKTISRIAVNFLPKMDGMRQQLADTQSETKLLSMIPLAKMGESQVIARAGSIDADPEGRLMFQMADNLKFTAFFLGKVLERAREQYAFTSQALLPLLFQSPLFDQGRTFFFEQGIEAYLAGDHLKAIHVLVPQIEHCLRRLLTMLGKPTNKHRRSDLHVMIEKSLNDILEAEPVIKQCLGEDATFYLRVLLCDPRGINVRNNLSHGLMNPNQFDRFLSDRVLHVLFMLSLLRSAPAPDPGATNDD